MSHLVQPSPLAASGAEQVLTGTRGVQRRNWWSPFMTARLEAHGHEQNSLFAFGTLAPLAMLLISSADLVHAH